jgi:SAM-dependent methyltransferase
MKYELTDIRFGEESVEKMVDWSLEHVPPSLNPAILEVGSGNGNLLFALAEIGYSQKLLAGIDYSEDAVRLARNISRTRNLTEISFNGCNFLQDVPPLLPSMVDARTPTSWDLVLDKGTYDAIALGPKDELGSSPAAAYPGRLVQLLKPGGIFLITCKITYCVRLSDSRTHSLYSSLQLHGGRAEKQLYHARDWSNIPVS